MLNPMLDMKTGQAALTTNEWKKRADLYVSINRDIPFNRRDQNKNGKDAFFKDRNMAILLDYGGRIGDIDQMYK